MGRTVSRTEARGDVARVEITVVVPVFNAGPWLGECIDSILGQTLGEIEIVCIDDGSTDGSPRILADRAARDRRVKVLTQPNRGVSAARNRAIDAARGEWLMMVDADDHIDPDTCRAALETARGTGADVVMWPYVREWPDGRRAVRRLVTGDRVWSGADARIVHRRMVGPVDGELRDPTALHSWGTVWGKLYRRDVIADSRFTDTAIVGSAEDALFNVEVFARVGTVAHLDRPLYHYRKSPSTFTGGYNPNLVEGWGRLHALMAALVEDRHLGHEFERALENRVALGLVGLGLNVWRAGGTFRTRLGALRGLLGDTGLRRALRRLPLWRLPLHWMIFFGTARLGLALALAYQFQFLFNTLE